MKKIKYSLLILLSAATFMGCQKEYVAEKSKTVAMAGKWWYELSYDANADGLFNDADGDALLVSYADYGEASLLTSNTNANDADSILISDQLSFRGGQWPMTFHAAVNLSDLTVKPATDLLNYANENAAVTIFEGKILKNAATTLSGGKTDSIYLHLGFADSPGDHYLVTGHRDTGFLEDQHH